MTHTASDRALARILVALGVAGTAIACGSTVDKPDSDAGDAAAAASGASQGGGLPAGSSLAVAGSSGGAGGAGGSGGIIDPTGAGGAQDDCGNPLAPIDPGVDVAACEPVPGEYMPNERKQIVCYPAPTPPEDCSVYTPECVSSTYGCGLQDTASGFCGPVAEVTTACCYVLYGDCPVGRPFLVEGRARVATPATRGDWSSAEHPDAGSLDAGSRAALAAYWTREALTEHASIASFARFVLELLAVGAPADLLRDAQRALVDEQAHARTAFAFASTYAGVPVGPGALHVRGSLGDAIDRRSVALSTAREACIAETVSALLLADAAALAVDPVVRAALTRMADEELEHAALGWRTLAWLLADADARADAGLRAEVAAVFASAADHVGLGTLVAIPAGAEDTAAAHGLQPEATRRRVARAALASVVAPAAQALLSGRMPDPPVAASARASAQACCASTASDS